MKKKKLEYKNLTKNISHSGLRHWWHQKLSAILMIPLLIWLLINLPSFLYLSFEKKIQWVNNTTNFFFLMCFFLIASYHMKLGLTVVLEDYIHNSSLKRFLLKMLEIFTLSLVVLIVVLIVIFLRRI